MLELRPSCEHCETLLDPQSDDARICTYECTFCSRCATWELLGICPNCDGELVTRPRRSAAGLVRNPASTVVRHQKADLKLHVATVSMRLANGDLPSQVWTVAFANQRPVDAVGVDGIGGVGGEGDGYSEMADDMDALAEQQPGFISVDSAREADGAGITVSRWSSIAAMVSWRRVVAHEEAQRYGRDRWYESYRSDVARVDRTAEFVRTGE
jgi:uncharacterized protein